MSTLKALGSASPALRPIILPAPTSTRIRTASIAPDRDRFLSLIQIVPTIRFPTASNSQASHDPSLFVGLVNSFDPPVQSQKSCDNRSADLLELVVREVNFVELRVQ